MERETDTGTAIGADPVNPEGGAEEAFGFAPYSPWSRPPARPNHDPEARPNHDPEARPNHDPEARLGLPARRDHPAPAARTAPDRSPVVPLSQDWTDLVDDDPEPTDPTLAPDAVAPAGTRAGAPPVHPFPEIEVPLRYAAPTAEEFATRRAVRPREWVATTGVRAAARRSTLGLVRLGPGRRERDGRLALSSVRRAFGGLRQITIVNPKGGAGKTVATLMLGCTFGQTRGGFVLAWDNNETQGTLGMRAQPDLHARTVRDLLHDLDRFRTGGRIGELAAYIRAQDEAMFDVLASDEAATAGEMLTARAFREIRDVVGRFYKLILVDTGNNVRAENWQAAIDATDQLVITMSARNDSAETAARLLDHLEQTGRRELVRRAITVVTMPPHRKQINPRPVERHFGARCRMVLRVPYDRHLDSGAPVRYAALSPESRRAWLRVAAAVADGL
jgi:MinD-like ATPase involved in chromosome partitioning or flagellar assembly